ncbi:hypothetical protein BDV36DRAFT_306583 [Aspergillus pseudocaelatus]|uniref:AB hydrolase-1 domain-containing protein n=1 Tax=Aspergillus pseudocaelatus TaxID=1825620 RepID=A0ABQ6W1A4_9EURO|nr:hypothetical protein BDV36DRAFT_306583 [Aspergillus pseudocaelatus]
MWLFKLTLLNGAVVSGIKCIHPITLGRTHCSSPPEHTASRASIAFAVPFGSIDRLCYGDTSSFMPVPEGADLNQETGFWLHHYTLPVLWLQFGNACNCVVLLCHSLGVMGGIVAAALHGKDQNPPCPLGGIIASGMGDRQPPAAKDAPRMLTIIGPDHVLLPVPIKDKVMLLPETYSPGVLAQSERLNAVTPQTEIQEWAAHVEAPVMFCLVENDPFFVATEEEVGTCMAVFTNSVRVDGSLVKGATHCMES